MLIFFQFHNNASWIKAVSNNSMTDYQEERTRTVPVHNPEEEMWVQWHHWRTNPPKLKEEKYKYYSNSKLQRHKSLSAVFTQNRMLGLFSKYCYVQISALIEFRKKQ